MTESTEVLESASFISQNACDVFVQEENCKRAAEEIYNAMQAKHYSTATWASHPLHPKLKDRTTVDWIFMVDTLNFSFWSDFDDDDTGNPESQRFTVAYNENTYTGYWSLCAAINKALDSGIPITSPEFWASEEFTTDILASVFHSETKEQIPLFDARFKVLKEAGRVLTDVFHVKSFADVIPLAEKSAVKLVNLVASKFESYNDESLFLKRKVRILKRAQILISDLWACFNQEGLGEFTDIDEITMFADYRVPQILHNLGTISYSKTLTAHIQELKPIEHNDRREVEIRGVSIWAVELIRRAILKKHPQAKINAILIDFYLWDTAKLIQQQLGGLGDNISCHRTRSIYY